MGTLGQDMRNQGNAGLQQGANMGFNFGQEMNAANLASGQLQQNQEQQLMNAIKAQFGGAMNAPAQGLQTLIAALTGSHSPTQTNSSSSSSTNNGFGGIGNLFSALGTLMG
jgi:uncharacterized protein with von Willebrand factor type A (vWA) domain